MLTQQRLRELLHYDPNTGIFTWRVARGNIKSGATAGSAAYGHGYRVIKLDGRAYLAHRLAWLYVHGAFPVAEVDHINGVVSDNRVSNLRPAELKQNRRNRRAKRGTRTGLKGVTYIPRNTIRPYQARIYVDGRSIFLGNYSTASGAHAAYAAAAPIYHGAFSRAQ